MQSVKRLYTELKPNRYELEITPDITTATFTGRVSVTLKKTGRPSKRITFHQHDLKILDATITRHNKKGDTQIAVTRINNHASFDEVRLHTSESIFSGDYTVTMSFSGIITEGATGLYPCHYKLDGQDHVMLATQFESHHAREVFPCIDEPEAKATFDLTLNTPKDQVVLANTPVKDQSERTVPGGVLLETTFETTPKMSTYLLAFVIGEMHSKATHTKHGTEVSVWATIAQPPAALDFALDVAKRSIEFFEDYFGVRYPLAKCDYVALPDMGSSTSAMENWGLITYRESSILAYPGETSQSTQEYITVVIAHETAHQWFGNLVTMRWWDDLWLNESFANMMEYRATDALFPEWQVWDEFIAHEGLAAMRRDATAGVQAVKTAVRHPDEIGTLFDPYIVYAKGGRLLYMLMQYIGEEAFRKGLSLYFKTHAYGNTAGDDLWKALAQASNVDVSAFMKAWLNAPGFPVIAVDQKASQLTLDQKHFLESGAVADGRTWPVPLFATRDDVPALIDKQNTSIQMSNPEFVLVNQGFAGHYLVNYVQPEHKVYVVNQVKAMAVGPSDRLMLLNAASMLSKAGEQFFGDVLQLLSAYKHEQAEPVWGVIALILGEAQRFIDLDAKLESEIKTFIRQLMAAEYLRLGWDERPIDTAADRKLRATIIGLGSYGEVPEIIEKIKHEYDAYVKHGSSLPPELRTVIFSTVVREKVNGAHEFLLNLHDTTTNSDLRDDAALGLSATRDAATAKQLLDRLLNPALVKPQDATHWLVFLLRNRHTRGTAWDWLTGNWAWAEQTYGRDKSYDNFPRYMATVCNTRDYAKKYKGFFEPLKENVALKRNILVGLNEIDTRVTWLERDLSSVQTFFGNKNAS